jgi:uncharacterized protein (TIGR03437 family)
MQSSSRRRPVVAASPGVYTVDGQYAAALNQDGTINSAEDPAAAGSIVSVFATALGRISPAPADGEITHVPQRINVTPTKVGKATRISGFMVE